MCCFPDFQTFYIGLPFAISVACSGAKDGVSGGDRASVGDGAHQVHPEEGQRRQQRQQEEGQGKLRLRPDGRGQRPEGDQVLVRLEGPQREDNYLVSNRVY